MTPALSELAAAIPALFPRGYPMNLWSFIVYQREWSLRNFGPAARTRGITEHIRKELAEIEAAPLDLEEWIDVVILALDGAWRTGACPSAIVRALEEKQRKNFARRYPDWRTLPEDRAIEHLREGE